MPKKDLIIALSKSNLDYDSSIIPQLWKVNNEIPEQVVDLLLTALESTQEEYPEILSLLLADCALSCTIDAQRKPAVPGTG